MSICRTFAIIQDVLDMSGEEVRQTYCGFAVHDRGQWVSVAISTAGAYANSGLYYGIPSRGNIGGIIVGFEAYQYSKYASPGVKAP